MFGFRQQSVRIFGWCTILFIFPVAKCFRLIIRDIHWPIPWHVHYVKNGSQSIFMRPGRTDIFPKEGLFQVAICTPRPSIVRPVLLSTISPLDDKLIKFTIAYHVLTRHERRYINIAFSVFIIPAERGEICWLTKIYRHIGVGCFNRNHLISRIMVSFNWMRRNGCWNAIIGWRVHWWPILWHLH